MPRGLASLELGAWSAGDARQGAAECESRSPLSQAEGISSEFAGYLGLLAELEVDAGNAEGALTLIDNGLAMASGGQHYADSFLHRLRGDILLKRDPADPAPAEEAYRTAIVVAKQQAARGYELRAALALAKLYQSTGRPADAHAVLAPALEGFSPTPEMPEIAEAQALLATSLADDEVKKPLSGSVNVGSIYRSPMVRLFLGQGLCGRRDQGRFGSRRRTSERSRKDPETICSLWSRNA